MAFESKTAVTGEQVSPNSDLISEFAPPVVSPDPSVFLNASQSANLLVTESAGEHAAPGVSLDDNGSASTSFGSEPLESASTNAAFEGGPASDTHDAEAQAVASEEYASSEDTGSNSYAEVNFGKPAGSHSTSDIAPITVAISTSSNSGDWSGAFSAPIPPGGNQTFVAPQSTYVPVATAPAVNSPDGLDPTSIVASPGDEPASVLVNGDGEAVSVLSNSTAGSGGSSTGSGGSSSSSSGTASSSPFVINVTYDASVNNAPAAFKTDVAAVVQYFESHFTDHVAININVGYGEVGGYTLGSGALGESLTYLNSYSYSQIKNALSADAKTADDATAVASLPATSPVNGTFWTSTAEAKALGLMGASSQVDGFVGFASGNLFDYDSSNGITGGQYDFYGTVAHEISEVMGRSLMTGSTIGNTHNSYDVLDLFHYSANGVRDFVGSTPGYFSVNGGATNLDNFNTNPNGDYGDWASSAGNDSFSAFASPGVVDAISQTDLRELDVLGWDLGSSGSTPSTPPSTPPAKPDLTISKFAFTGAHFSYEVDNTGAGAAGASTAGIYVSTSPNGASSLAGTINTPALAAGGADTESGVMTWGNTTTGTFYVSVSADTKNVVAESNESNNHSGQIALVIGNSASNALTGTSSNDVIFGMGGKDTLTGGAGADQFVFNTALNAATNVATIADFSSVQGDKIDLDHTIFAKLTPEALGAALASSDFFASTNGAAHLATDHILYNTTTGVLSYDPDGTGAAASVQFAIAALHPALTAHDFIVV